MELFDYIKENYREEGEPILASELPCKSKGYLRVQLKELVDQGKLWRFMPGIYYLPYKFRSLNGCIRIDLLEEKKFYRNRDDIYGYETRFSLYNNWQFSTQVPYIPQICTNKTSCNRIVNLGKSKYYLYRPRILICKDNVNELKFLDLMENIFTMTEVRGKEMDIRLQIFIDEVKPDFEKVSKLIDLYPVVVYKNLKKVGLLNVLV